MADKQSLARRWENYRPSKATWFWSCAACIVATLVVRFTWGGWVTGGTSTRMAADAADWARAQMAAAGCVNRFGGGSAAVAQLTELKNGELQTQ